MRKLLRSYVDKKLQRQGLLLDLCYCYDCVQEYHRLAEELIEREENYKKKIQTLDIDRLTQTIEKALPENTVERKVFDPLSQEIATKLQVPLMEILRYPYFLHHEQLSACFTKGIIALNQCGHPLKLEEKLPGAYLLRLVHPDPEVRSWAVRSVRSLGLLNPDNYDLLMEVIRWMVTVVQLNMFLEPENMDAALPSHLFIPLTRREYWLGLFVLLRQMDVPTVRMCFITSTEHVSFLQTILSSMESVVEEEDGFWPMLQCFVVLLERLENRIWQIPSFHYIPSDLFNFIISNQVYRHAIQQWQDGDSMSTERLSYSYASTLSHSPGRFHKTSLAWFHPFVQSLLDFDSGGECVSEVVTYLHNMAANCSLRSTFKPKVLSSSLRIIHDLFTKRMFFLLVPTVSLWAADVVDEAIFGSVDNTLVDLTQRLLQHLLKTGYRLGYKNALKYCDKLKLAGPKHLSPDDKEKIVSLLVQTFEASRSSNTLEEILGLKTKMDIIQLNPENLWTQGTLPMKGMEDHKEDKRSTLTITYDQRRLAHKDIGTARSSITRALDSDIREEMIDPTVRYWGKPGPSSRVSSSEDDDGEDGHPYQIKRSKRSFPIETSVTQTEHSAIVPEGSEIKAAEGDVENTDPKRETKPKRRHTARKSAGRIRKETPSKQKRGSTSEDPIVLSDGEESATEMPEQKAPFSKEDIDVKIDENNLDDEALLEMMGKPDSPPGTCVLNIQSENQKEEALGNASMKADLSSEIYSSDEKPLSSVLKRKATELTLPHDGFVPKSKAERVENELDTVLYPELEDIFPRIAGNKEDETRHVDIKQDSPITADTTKRDSRVQSGKDAVLTSFRKQVRNDSIMDDDYYEQGELILNVQEDAFASMEEDLEDIYSTQTEDMEENNTIFSNRDDRTVSNDESIGKSCDLVDRTAPGEAITAEKRVKHVSFADDADPADKTVSSGGPFGPQTSKPAITTPSKALTEEEFFRKILSVNVADLERHERPTRLPRELPSVLEPVTNCFESMDQYYDTFKPLFFTEIWEKIVNRWWDKKVDKKRVFMDVLDGRTSNNIIPCSGFLTDQQEHKALFPMQRDLVVVRLIVSDRRGGFHYGTAVFGVVETIDVQKVRLPRSDSGGEDATDTRKFKLTLNIRAASHFRPKRKSRLEVNFVTSLLTALRQWRGMIHLSKSLLACDILKPRKADYFCANSYQHSSLASKEYNESQAKVISTAANAMQMPFPKPRICLVQGPPGTGKSYTIVGLVKEILNQPQEIPLQTAAGSSNGHLANKVRILLCAPSNVAIDELIGQIEDGRIRLDKRKNNNENRRRNMQSPITEAFSKNCGDLFLVRVGRKEEILPAIRKFSLDCLTKQAQENECASATAENLVALKDKITECDAKERTLNQLIWQSRHHYPQQLKQLQDEKAALKNCKHGLQDKLRVENAKQERIRRDILDSADIICTTLSGTGSTSLKHDLQLNRSVCRRPCPFTCVIVDEACQSTELDLLIPLEFGTSKLVMFGDPEQLPPTVLSVKAKENLYGRSMFERLNTYIREQDMGNPLLVLEEQYRMHPEIASFPSQHVYSKGLRSHSSIPLETRQFPLTKHYAFFDVHCGQERGALWNPVEADMIADLCCELKKIVRPQSVGIITPYREQISEIKRRLSDRGLFKGNDSTYTIQVDKVDGFQGKEKEVIILSCVRANNYCGFIGFVGEKRRMNVALTRARHALYIFGHMETLKGGSNEWRALVEDAQKRRCLFAVGTVEDVQRVLSIRSSNDAQSLVEDPRLDNKLAPDERRYQDKGTCSRDRPLHQGNTSVEIPFSAKKVEDEIMSAHGVHLNVRNQVPVPRNQTRRSVTIKERGDISVQMAVEKSTRREAISTNSPDKRPFRSRDVSGNGQTTENTTEKVAYSKDTSRYRHRDGEESTLTRHERHSGKEGSSRYRHCYHGNEGISRHRYCDSNRGNPSHRRDDGNEDSVHHGDLYHEKEGGSSHKKDDGEQGTSRHRERNRRNGGSTSRYRGYDTRGDTSRHMYSPSRPMDHRDDKEGTSSRRYRHHGKDDISRYRDYDRKEDSARHIEYRDDKEGTSNRSDRHHRNEGGSSHIYYSPSTNDLLITMENYDATSTDMNNLCSAERTHHIAPSPSKELQRLSHAKRERSEDKRHQEKQMEPDEGTKRFKLQDGSVGSHSVRSPTSATTAPSGSLSVPTEADAIIQFPAGSSRFTKTPTAIATYGLPRSPTKTAETIASSCLQSSPTKTAATIASSGLQRSPTKTAATIASSGLQRSPTKTAATIASTSLPNSSTKTAATIASSGLQRSPTKTAATIASSGLQRSPTKTAATISSSALQSSSTKTAATIASSGLQRSSTKTAATISSSGLQSSPTKTAATIASSGLPRSSTKTPTGISSSGLPRSPTKTAANIKLTSSSRSPDKTAAKSASTGAPSLPSDTIEIMAPDDSNIAQSSSTRSPSKTAVNIALTGSSRSPVKPATNIASIGLSSLPIEAGAIVSAGLPSSSNTARHSNQKASLRGRRNSNVQGLGEIDPSAQEAADVVRERHPPAKGPQIIPARRARVASVDAEVSLLRARACEKVPAQKKKEGNGPLSSKFNKKKMCETFRGRKSWS